MAFDSATADLATKAKFPSTAADWFIANDCFTCEDIGLLASDEKLVDVNIIDLMVAKGDEAMKSAGKKVAVRKFWTYCRTVFDEARKPKVPDPNVPVDDTLPTQEDLDTAAKWSSRHNFVLPDAQFLIRSQVKTLARDFQAGIVRIWLAEELRTRSCSNPRNATQLAVEPGRPVSAVEVIADRVDKAFELYVRIRAFLMTLAYVSVSDPTWFPLQTAMEVSEQIMKFITNTYDSRSPPLSFLLQAWAATIHHFSEQIRIQILPPSKIIGAIGSWEHKWKWSPAPSGGGAASGSRDPDNKALQNKLDSVNGQVKRLKQAADRQSMAPTRRQRSRSNDGRRGGGNGGKGSGKGGGGGKSNKGNSNGGNSGGNVGTFTKRSRRGAEARTGRR